MDLFDLGLEDIQAPQAADPKAMVKQFTARPCGMCPLTKLSPSNPGFIGRGSFAAKIAVLVDMPSSEDMTMRQALTDMGRSGWQEWVRYLGLGEKDFFITHVVQCKTQVEQPPATKGKGRRKKVVADDKPTKIKLPELEDANTCFYRKALPVLKALPNKEIVMALGTLPVRMFLGEEYKSKENEGNFYLSDLLPGVPIFCMEHPRDYTAGGDQKKGRMFACLDVFRQKYLTTGDILKIHKLHAAARAAGVDADLNQQLV